MKLLVTGASGFVGRNVLLGVKGRWEVVAVYHACADFPEFLKDYNLPHVKPIRVDLCNPSEVRKIREISDHFDSCIYLAANGDPALSAIRPAYDLANGPVALVNLLEQVSFGRFVYFSSGAVYEGHKGPVSPAVSVSPKLPYAVSKFASEGYVRHFQATGQIAETVIMRFFGGYGPFEPERKIFTRMIRGFALARDPRFVLRGNGENLIDAMYVDDAVRAIGLLLDQPGRWEGTLDLSSHNPCTLNELVKRAAMVFSLEAEIRYEGTVPEYNEFYSTDSSMKERVGFLPAVSLEDGLKRLRSYLARDGARRELRPERTS